MFLRMCSSAGDDLGQICKRVHRLKVKRHLPQRSGKTVHTGQRQSPHRHTVHRPQQQHPMDTLAPGYQSGVGQGGCGARIGVARMGHDDRFRNIGRHPKGSPQRLLKQHLNLLFQRQRLCRVEVTGHGSRAYRLHSHLQSLQTQAIGLGYRFALSAPGPTGSMQSPWLAGGAALRDNPHP